MRASRFRGDEPYFRRIRSLAAFSGDLTKGLFKLLSGDFSGDLANGLFKLLSGEANGLLRPLLSGDLTPAAADLTGLAAGLGGVTGAVRSSNAGGGAGVSPSLRLTGVWFPSTQRSGLKGVRAGLAAISWRLQEELTALKCLTMSGRIFLFICAKI